MKWIGQHIWDLTSRFRSDIYFEGLAETAETRGLVVDANGKVSINPLSGDEHATHIYENVRNDEGATIPVGTPVYSKGEVGASERILVGIADASDPNKMPAIGITNTELTTTGSTRDGLATLVGVYNTNLTGFTGLSVNDIVYVAPSGGLTISKPAGTNLIQNVGIILKTNGTIIQGLQVTCIGRTNDIPNSLQLRKADGTNAGLISMTGNDMVLSNATGDVLIGSTTYQVGGDQDIFIGDGINSVDLVFEQSGAIKGDDSSVNLTFGGGGGTITFADKVNFIGGGIENEFQFNNLTADGNFELSPITTTTSGGVLNGGFLNPAAEAKQVHMPQVLNDLAGFNHWGTVTVTGLYKTRTGSPGSYAYSNPVLPGDFANAFDGTSSTAGSWYSDNGASGTVQGEGVITLEWTNEALYGLWFGLVFGSDNFVPSRIKMEAYQTDVGWRTFADLTGVSYTDIGNIILRQIDSNSGTGAATNKLRFTLGHKNSGNYSYFRIHTIYLANYAQGNNNLSGLGTDQTRGYHYLERYRPNYAWGNFNPGQTTTYNLGSSSYRWAIGYFNSLDVAQSLNIAGSISAGASVGNLNTSAGIGQDLEYGNTAITTLRFDSDRWRLYAGGTSSEVATITEGGNFGIGTTSPNKNLTVEWLSNNTVITQEGLGGGTAGSGVLIQNTSSTANSYANLDFRSNNADGRIAYKYNSINDGDFHFITDNGNNPETKLFIKNNGNVGIGTTSPSEKLDVFGNIRVGDNNKIKIGNGGDMYLQHDGTNSVLVNINGNLTISNQADDKDIIFQSDDGSGGVETYFFLDGSYGANPYTIFPDNSTLAFGSNRDLLLVHDATDSKIDNYVGDLKIRNFADDKDIIFQCDDGSGGTETYFFLDGSNGLTTFPDNKKLGFGNASDLRIQHDGSNSYISQVGTGDLYIQNAVDDKDIIFQSDDGSGGLATYFYLDGSAASSDYYYTRFTDKSSITFGDGNDLRIYHDSTDSSIENENGDLYIQQKANDKDIIFRSDDGSGGVTTYLRIDGGEEIMKAGKNLRFNDSVKGTFGNSDDLQIYHDGSNSYIDETGTGNLVVRANSQLAVQKYTGETMFKGIADGAFEAYHNNVKKFETTSTGVDVLGNIVSEDTYPSVYVNHSGTLLGGIRADATSKLELKTLTTAPLSFQVNSSEKMRVTSDGNVGIGTSSPSEKLHVNGNVLIESTNPSLLFTDTNSDSDYSIKVNGGVLNVRDETNDIARISLKSNGNVGIGTTSPSELLTIAAESPTLRFEDISSSNYTEMYVNNFDTYLNTNGRFFIQNQGSTKVTFKSDGNVGIGTTSPSEKLEVDGKIKATDINFSGLPTSSAGLSSGDVWNDGGTLKIVS